MSRSHPRWPALNVVLVYGHYKDRIPTHGYAATREARMLAFARSWGRRPPEFFRHRRPGMVRLTPVIGSTARFEFIGSRQRCRKEARLA
jgi:hypothetical protein